MLRYNIKVTEDDISREKMSWDEKFLSQDLSYVSGVTSTSYHLEKYGMIPASNSMVSSDATLRVVSENVHRNGYCIIRDKEYDVKKVKVNGKDVNYIEVNGTFYYEVDGKYVIDNMLKKDGDSVISGEVIVDSKTNSGNTVDNESKDTANSGNTVDNESKDTVNSGNTVNIDTIVWIEDGKVTIDGKTYWYDENEEKITLDGVYFIDNYESVTKCKKDGIKFFNFNPPIEVTKFKLTKAFDEIGYDYSKVSYCSYLYFINFNGECHNIAFTKNKEDGSFTFFCDYNGKELPLFFKVSDSYIELNSANLASNGIEGVYDYESLKSITSYVKVSCKDGDVYVEVEHDVISANDGDRVLVQLSDSYTSFGIGDVITFHNDDSTEELKVYGDGNEFDKKNEFVVYNGNKIGLVKNLCDTVTIGGHEYPIHYVNGMYEGKEKDCVIDVDGSNVTMKLVSNKKVKPYGYVIVEGHEVATNDDSYNINEYNINNYDGVTINGKSYKRYKSESENVNVIPTDLPSKYMLEVDDVVGSSILVCKAFLPTEGLPKNEYITIGKETLQRVVGASSALRLTSVNKIFGVREITPLLPFSKKSYDYKDITSSKYYYDLFDSLSLYCSMGYVSVKFPMTMHVGDDAMQDDIVENDFFEHEKSLAINPIIDMEKDVYSPKYIDNNGKYKGSETVFLPISEIRVNLHFRTRDLDTWKVNEGFNLVNPSGNTDGWFVTDYYPYSGNTKMKDKNGNNIDLMEVSDLVGLLNFTNDDIYYQKSKVSKTFLRFSYYDSIDPNRQMLLATSTVFMDEHTLFKKFIDNSRKNVNTYSLVSAEKNTRDLNKISVMSELKDGNSAVIEESKRLSSRFVITNKYDTDTSSEGFYIYMFKEYSENLHPREIFMKVEFNHAGIGTTIPFIKPMRWWNKGGSSKIWFPKEELSLSKDRDEMKKGVELEKKNAQDYIPLYAVYDFKNKEYVYVFDKRYVTVNDGVASINLFELKLRDESNDSTFLNDIKSYGIDSIF